MLPDLSQAVKLMLHVNILLQKKLSIHNKSVMHWIEMMIEFVLFFPFPLSTGDLIELHVIIYTALPVAIFFAT